MVFSVLGEVDVVTRLELVCDHLGHLVLQMGDPSDTLH